jgi:hypothetical protein
LPRPQETDHTLFVSHRKNPRAHLLVHKSPFLALSHGGGLPSLEKNNLKKNNFFGGFQSPEVENFLQKIQIFIFGFQYLTN